MAISNFSIITSSDIFNLDATVSVSRTLSSKVSEFPVEDGSSVVDNVVNSGQTISMRGVISDVKAARSDNISTTSFIKELEGIRGRKERVTVNTGLQSGGVNSVGNCIITSMVFSQDKVNGVTTTGRASYKVALSFKQIRVVSSATEVTREVAVDLIDVTEVAEETPKAANTVVVGNLGTSNLDTGEFIRFVYPEGANFN